MLSDHIILYGMIIMASLIRVGGQSYSVKVTSNNLRYDIIDLRYDIVDLRHDMTSQAPVFKVGGHYVFFHEAMREKVVLRARLHVALNGVLDCGYLGVFQVTSRKMRRISLAWFRRTRTLSSMPKKSMGLAFCRYCTHIAPL